TRHRWIPAIGVVSPRAATACGGVATSRAGRSPRSTESSPDPGDSLGLIMPGMRRRGSHVKIHACGAGQKADRECSVMSSTMTRPLGWLEQRPPSGSSASDLLEREELLQLLDRAISKRITVVSAPPGSGKTSLLRAWADRSTGIRRVAFTSVDRD